MITNRNNTLKLRKQSIRNLTHTELGGVHGGTSFPGTYGHSSNCGRSTRA